MQLQEEINQLKIYIENLKKGISKFLPHVNIDEKGNIYNAVVDNEYLVPQPLCMNSRKDYYNWIQEEREAREQNKLRE